jgi:hypothetical protein
VIQRSLRHDWVLNGTVKVVAWHPVATVVRELRFDCSYDWGWRQSYTRYVRVLRFLSPQWVYLWIRTLHFQVNLVVRIQNQNYGTLNKHQENNRRIQKQGFS